LKLKDSSYKLSEVRTDPKEAKATEIAQKEAEQQKVMKTACEIDSSLQERIKEGAITNIV